MRRFFCVLLLLLCFTFSLISARTLGIMHDDSWKSIHSTYRPSILVLQMILRNIQNNPYNRVVSRSTGGSESSDQATVQWSHIIVMASCKTSQRIVRTLAKQQDSRPTIILNFEHCSQPKKFTTTVYLKLAQDCFDCFQRSMDSWMNSAYDRSFGKYNGDQLSLLKERNLAAKEFLQTRSFKLGTVPFPPYTAIVNDRSGKLVAQGFYIDRVNDIVRAINSNYTLVLPKSSQDLLVPGGYINGTWTGSSGMVYRREIDCGVYVYAVNGDMNRDLDIFSSAAFVTNTGIMIPAPAFPLTISTLFRPFHYDVWIVVIFSSLLVAIMLCCITKKQHGNWADYGRQILIVVQLLACNGVESPIRNLPDRMILGAWCIVVLICGYVYTSTLTSYRAVPKPKPLVNSLTELAYEMPLEPLVFSRGIYNNLFADAKEGPFLVLREYFVQHPEHVLNNHIEGVVKVMKGDYAMISVNSFLRTLIDKEYEKTRECSLTMAKEPISREIISWLFPKNSATSLVFNLWYTMLTERGLETFASLLYEMHPQYCSKLSDFIQPKPILSLDQVESMFVILMVGLTVAALAFLGELLVYFVLQKR